MIRDIVKERRRGLAIRLATMWLAILFPASADGGERPLFRDFVGLCGHTVSFKPEVYGPVCRWVRDYHPVRWDLEGDTARLPEWPYARNRVSWETVYGSWRAAGLRVSTCLMFDDMKDDWKDMPRDAGAYARSFAEHFGPGGKWPFVECVELGNEPGLYDDPSYRAIFEAMARGIRAGNPRMKVATCNIEAGSSDRYWKGVDVLKGLDELYDIIRIHRYAIAEGWPVWRRSYPEDPGVPFLSHIQKLLDWRDGHVPDKPVWVSEFGWDASTRKPDPAGEWVKWIGTRDEDQAQWLVRSFFLFARMGVAKSFVYFFDDKDEPRLHAASGLTRNGRPKPAFHAVAWMLKSLADHRFSRVRAESLDDGYVFEFTPESARQPIIHAVWHATRDGQPVVFASDAGRPTRAERMPLESGPAQAVDVKWEAGAVNLTAGTRPVLVWTDPRPLENR